MCHCALYLRNKTDLFISILIGLFKWFNTINCVNVSTSLLSQLLKQPQTQSFLITEQRAMRSCVCVDSIGFQVAEHLPPLKTVQQFRCRTAQCHFHWESPIRSVNKILIRLNLTRLFLHFSNAMQHFWGYANPLPQNEEMETKQTAWKKAAKKPF